MTEEANAFFRRINAVPRGKPGVNQRYGRDSYLRGLFVGLKELFAPSKQTPDIDKTL
jgi:hypothetical protein